MLRSAVALPLTVGMETGLYSGFPWLEQFSLSLTVRKLLLIVGQSVVPPFPLLMDLLSTPLRTDCTRACERGRSSDL